MENVFEEGERYPALDCEFFIDTSDVSPIYCQSPLYCTREAKEMRSQVQMLEDNTMIRIVLEPWSIIILLAPKFY